MTQQLHTFFVKRENVNAVLRACRFGRKHSYDFAPIRGLSDNLDGHIISILQAFQLCVVFTLNFCNGGCQRNGMLVMIVCTMRSYRALKLPATKKEVTWLIVGWLAALVVLPLLMSYGIMPLMPLTYSKFSPYFFINVLYSYVRLALVNVLLVRTLAIWRVKREAKKANRNATET